MEKFKFNSQICTTIEQSERLLELGLNPETADCMYSVMTKSYNGRYILEEDRQYNLILFRQEEVQNVGFSHYEHIPAWSLHRLIEIMDVYEVVLDWKFGIYECVISVLEERIKDGLIDKKYLKQ